MKTSTEYFLFLLLCYTVSGYCQTDEKSMVIGTMTNKPNALLVLNAPDVNQGFILPPITSSNAAPDTRSRPIYLSTTLSPNASEPENRTVKIFGDDISTTDFLFQVFNRWGNLVFESMSLSEMQNMGWDGKRSGETLSSGSYPYKISYQDLTGRKFKKEGFISIVN